jgi:hypothetical protein
LVYRAGTGIKIKTTVWRSNGHDWLSEMKLGIHTERNSDHTNSAQAVYYATFYV